MLTALKQAYHRLSTSVSTWRHGGWRQGASDVEWSAATRATREDIAALEGFIRQFYLGEDLTPQQSKQNLENGTVRIVGKRHSGNGLLITGNGYLLTAMHCIEDGTSGAHIRLRDGSAYPIERICAYGPKEDVGLAKVALPGPAAALRYRFYDTTRLEETLSRVTSPNGLFPVALLTMNGVGFTLKGGIVTGFVKEQQVMAREGMVTQSRRFRLTIDARPGDSGGPVVTTDGRLMGFITSGVEKYYIASGATLDGALTMLQRYAYRRR